MTTLDALKGMARHVALQLVGEELAALAGRPVTLTIHPQEILVEATRSQRKALAPKPGTAKRVKNMRAARAEVDLSTKKCRECGRVGAAKFTGAGRQVKCKCGFTWRANRSRQETPAPLERTAKSSKSCIRCDHPAGDHIAGEACTFKGCVCKELYV